MNLEEPNADSTSPPTPTTSTATATDPVPAELSPESPQQVSIYNFFGFSLKWAIFDEKYSLFDLLDLLFQLECAAIDVHALLATCTKPRTTQSAATQWTRHWVSGSDLFLLMHHPLLTGEKVAKLRQEIAQACFNPFGALVDLEKSQAAKSKDDAPSSYWITSSTHASHSASHVHSHSHRDATGGPTGSPGLSTSSSSKSRTVKRSNSRGVASPDNSSSSSAGSRTGKLERERSQRTKAERERLASGATTTPSANANASSPSGAGSSVVAFDANDAAVRSESGVRMKVRISEMEGRSGFKVSCLAVFIETKLRYAFALSLLPQLYQEKFLAASGVDHWLMAKSTPEEVQYSIVVCMPTE